MYSYIDLVSKLRVTRSLLNLSYFMLNLGVTKTWTQFSGSSLRRHLHQLDVPDHYVRCPLCPPSLPQLEDRTWNPFGQNSEKKDDKVRKLCQAFILRLNCYTRPEIPISLHFWIQLFNHHFGFQSTTYLFYLVFLSSFNKSPRLI